MEYLGVMLDQRRNWRYNVRRIKEKIMAERYVLYLLINYRSADDLYFDFEVGSHLFRMDNDGQHAYDDTLCPAEEVN